MSLGMEVGLVPGDILFHETQLPLKRGTAVAAPSPLIWPISIVVKRSPISATAEHSLGKPVVYLSLI